MPAPFSVKEHLGNSESDLLDKNEIAITGMSGRFPESSNVEEFKNNLYQNIDMVTDDERRWPRNLYGLPERNGKIKNADLEAFDHTFFNVHDKQAANMDPQLRMIMEITYEAIVDAGMNPNKLRGTNTGVYLAISSSESESYFFADPDRVNGYGATGHAKAMFANRLSYAFDFKGPSYCIDTACSSSSYALTNAFLDIKTGRVDSAIVAGVNLCLRPIYSLQFHRLSMLSKDGKCKVFDESGDGYVRSEACVSIFIQRSKDAKRIYASILNAKTNVDGYKIEGITFPNRELQYRLIQQTYEEIGLDPTVVTYLEAHGTGTKVGDPAEITSVTEFFCKKRKSPLLIGSVKTNMGHSEPSSGLCAMAKIFLAMEKGEIPANLHYKNPNSKLTGIIEGKLKVVDENTRWNAGVAAMNSFGFGGANGHIIFAANPKDKKKSFKSKEVSRLVVVSGRTRESVEIFLEDALVKKDDDEYLALINEVHMHHINLHQFRGYIILSDHGMVAKEIMQFREIRPVWFIYSGMGSQWGKMAKDLMYFEIFRNTVNRCAAALKPEGIDLLPIILEEDDSTFDYILHSFIGIAACQIALTDLLFSLDICPDGMVGHSVGELGCAYADGCFTVEQTILASYWRGKSIVDTKLIHGKMAAVGLSWDACVAKLPSDVLPVCQNSKDNVTIAGPAESMNQIINVLSSEGIFVKEVNSSGYAFHSKYIKEAGPKLLKSLNKIIPNPKHRSSKWISTSIPKTAWDKPVAQTSSAEYHVHNLLSPVLFYDGLLHVPENAICIEIAPHGLMQAILRRALSGNCVNISLVKKNYTNNVDFFLTNIGRLYTAGSHPSIMKTFPPISYPVGRGTPMLGGKVRWDHSYKWFFANFTKELSRSSNDGIVEINLQNESNKFLNGHTIDGRILYPATGYLTLVWRAFAKYRGSDVSQAAVIMENIIFHRATIISAEEIIKLNVNILDVTGKFEITENGSIVVSGLIKVAENLNEEELILDPITLNKSEIILKKNDIYKELRIRGYDYSSLFCGIVEANLQGTSALLKWEENWITFMDTLLQFSILQNDARELFLPTAIEKIIINPIKHLEIVGQLPNQHKIIPAYSYSSLGIIKSGGVQIKGLKTTYTTRRVQTLPTLEKYSFISLKDNQLHKEKETFVASALQLVIENSGNALKIKTLELMNQNSELNNMLSLMFIKIIESEPVLIAETAVIVNNIDVDRLKAKIDGTNVSVINKNICESAIDENAHLIYGRNILSRDNNEIILKNMIRSINTNGFLLFDEPILLQKSVEAFKKFKLTVVQEQIFDNRNLMLIRSIKNINERNKILVHLTEQNYKWLDNLKKAMISAEINKCFVYLVCQGEESFGAVGLMNCLKNETGGKLARMYFIQDRGIENFSFNSSFYQDQLEKDLIMNIYKNGKWGTFRHIKLPLDQQFLQMEQCYVNTLVTGDLSSLNWIESPLAKVTKIDPRYELCTIYYSALNFKDILHATGKLNIDSASGDMGQQNFLGLEFAGRNSAGKRVMGMVLKNSIATSCVCKKDYMWEIPDNWTMEQAATIPCVYLTAYYALITCGRMKRDETILIHAGAGGVGIAAISIALNFGLIVFTTVGTKNKREFLKKRFPQLKDCHIGNSRDCSFEQMVMSETQGKGVDLILNSLSDEKLLASVRCLGQFGRFLEIGKFDMQQNSPLGLATFLKGISFHGILLDTLLGNKSVVAKEIVALVEHGIRTGAVEPLPTNIYDETQIEQAFRHLASGKHIGKIIIKIREEEPINICATQPKSINAIPRTYLYSNKSYIIVGGLGGFGLELGNWLISRGCKKLVLSTRSGIKIAYQSLMINRWNKKGVQVLIDTNDVAIKSGCQSLIQNTKKLGEVGGIFNLAVVLCDNLIENQTENDFEIVCAPKINATRNLDILSRKICPTLDYFVCFSSVSCGRGNIGQTNYGMANSNMERICENRQVSGYPGTAIQWGAVGDTGLVIESLGDNHTTIGGTMPQRMVSCLETLDLFLQQPYPVLSSMVIAEKRKIDSSTISIVHIMSNIMGLRDIKNISDNTSLIDLNMDSLMGTELKQILERNFDIFMTTQEIRNMTFGQLRKIDEKADGLQTKNKESIENGVHDEPIFNSELIPNEPLVCLKEDLNTTKKPIFIVHPIEGFTHSFSSITKHIHRPVYGFQCTLDAPLDSINSLSAYYLKLLKNIQNEGPYIIAGYSFGSLVAYNMGLQLEKNGEKLQLIMLDGSPKYVLWRIQSAESGRNQSQDTSVHESLGLAHFGASYGNLELSETYQILLNIPKYNDKLEKIAQLLQTKIKKPIDLISCTANQYYKKVLMAYSYKCEGKIKCDITLIKPTDNPSHISEDYDLSKVCEKKVEIITVKGDHKTFLTEKESVTEIAEKINSINY